MTLSSIKAIIVIVFQLSVVFAPLEFIIKYDFILKQFIKVNIKHESMEVFSHKKEKKCLLPTLIKLSFKKAVMF